MNLAAILIAAVKFGDSDEHETTRIARDLMPKCWDFTDLNNGRIRVQHGHKPPCNENPDHELFDETMDWQQLMCHLVNDFGPEEVQRAREKVSGMQNPSVRGRALQA